MNWYLSLILATILLFLLNLSYWYWAPKRYWNSEPYSWQEKWYELTWLISDKLVTWTVYLMVAAVLLGGIVKVAL